MRWRGRFPGGIAGPLLSPAVWGGVVSLALSGSARRDRRSVAAVSDPYWRGAADDEAMQDEHDFLWRAMLDTIDMDLAGRRVLDAGCNRGGFLRLLVDEAGIAEGRGYDPASGAIEDARRLAGQRPLTFETAVTPPAG